MSSKYFSVMAAFMFAAVCAYIGAAVFGGTDFNTATDAYSAADETRLEGIAVRREESLGSKPNLADGERLSAAAGFGGETALYCEDCDGFEHLEPEEVFGMSAAELERLMNEEPHSKADVGKLIYGFDWYFVCFAEGSIPEENSRCRLEFTQNGSAAYARLTAVRSEGGRTILTFRILDFSGELLRVRKSEAVISDCQPA